jgi:hypothetical protein
MPLKRTFRGLRINEEVEWILKSKQTVRFFLPNLQPSFPALFSAEVVPRFVDRDSEDPVFQDQRDRH